MISCRDYQVCVYNKSVPLPYSVLRAEAQREWIRHLFISVNDEDNITLMLLCAVVYILLLSCTEIKAEIGKSSEFLRRNC